MTLMPAHRLGPTQGARGPSRLPTPLSALCALLVGCAGGGDLGRGDGGGDGDPDGGYRLMDSGSDDDGGSDVDNDCVHTGSPVIDPETFDPCPMCEGGHCVPLSLVPEEQKDQLGDCDAESKCVPDEFIETGGDFLLDTCRSVGDSEGRCVSLCIPDVQAQADTLPQASCDADERCAPCFDPTTGEETGVCGLACDPGPMEDPTSFDRCCSDAGACVPTDTIPEDFQSQLGMDTCGGDTLCVPDSLADTSTPPPSCRSLGGGEGRCLPECLPDVQDQADRLPQGECADAHLCVPCYDPLTGEDTGACRIGDDMPAEPPFTFPGCCEHDGMTRGTCVPSELVPAEDRDSLDEDTCPEGMDYLCVPDVKLEDPDYVFPSCTTEESLIGGGEPGACVPDCLVGSFEGFVLGQSTCNDGELCAPCDDPLSGEPSGACE